MNSNKKLFTNYKKIILSIFLVLGMIIIIFTVIIPKIMEIWDIQNSLKEKNMTLEMLIKKRQLLEIIDKGNYIQYVSDAESAIPMDKDASSILVFLENLTQKSGFSINSINLNPGLISSDSASPNAKEVVSDEEKRHSSNYLSLAVSGTGNSDNFVEYINQMTNSRRIFDILSINTSFLSQENNNLTATLNLVVYYMPPLVNLGKEDSQLPQLTDMDNQILSRLSNMPNLGYLDVDNQDALPLGKNDLFAP